MKIFSEDELREFLESQDKLVIYGIGGMGGNLYRYLQRNSWLGKLSFFLVTDNPPEEFEGVPVKGIHDLLETEKTAPVMIATRQNFHEEIMRSLEEEKIWDYHTMCEDVLNLIEKLALEMPEETGTGQEKNDESSSRTTKKPAVGRGIQSITGLSDYLEELATLAKKYLVLFAAKGTLGLALNAEINRRLMALGTQNLLRKHWRGYIFASYLGKVLAEELESPEKSAIKRLEAEGIPIELESHPAHDGDRAVIRVGGHDYATNSNGLNIVVLDLEKNRLVDSVSFDTHKETFPCTRLELYLQPEEYRTALLGAVESSFCDKDLPKYRFEAGKKNLQRSLFPMEGKPVEDGMGEAGNEARRMAVFFREMCRQEAPVVLSGERIAFFHTIEAFPAEKLVRGMARRLGYPIGETCHMAEDACLDFSLVLSKGLLEMPEASQEAEICRDALLSLAARYEAEAERAGNETVAASFRQVPAHPARTFAEALQCVRFLLAALRIAGHEGVVLGRMDQYLYAFWKKDLEAGILSVQEARELLKEFLASVARSGDTASLTLGGSNAGGETSCNDMTGNFLELAAEAQLPPVVLVLRVDARTPKEILELAGRCRGLHQAQDRRILPELKKLGVPEELAVEYVLSSRGNILFPGHVRHGCFHGEVSLAKAVEDARDGIREEMGLAEAEDVLRDEVRAQVLGMLPFRLVSFPPSPLLSLFSVKPEPFRHGVAHFYVPCSSRKDAAALWNSLLGERGFSGSTEDSACIFLKGCLEDACERYSMFDKVLLPEPVWQEVSHE